jgi:diaminohydroxyphosphoribosylaminopyrimidine deaminase/5-amino-6-(5-phosphoribosylamino)uracil reductase
MIFRILEDQLREKSSAAKAVVKDAEKQAAKETADEADRRYMQLALTLGRRGLGRTWPNPAVGAVVVKDGVIVGRGWTQPGGRPHAEPEALRRAGEAARGATLYVTLEPCSHFGKSPPCADAIIVAGISRVVAAIEDPNPEVAGQGHARLRAAGIAVDVGLLADEAARDHAGHFRRVRDRRPHVILKLAVSADDKIAAAGHKQVAITGEAARTRVHLLRAQSDAILVGIGTVLADDPLLTCRLPGMAARSPVRVVLDRSLRMSGNSRLAHSARETPLWVVASKLAEAAAAARLGAAGAQVVQIAPSSAPEFDRKGLDLKAVLRALAEKGITRLMVEGGSRVASSFVAADLVDEVWLLRGPEPIGADGVAALDALPLSEITQSPRLKLRASETLGNDTLMIYERA